MDSMLLKAVPSQEAAAVAGPRQAAQWSPYMDNGGTVVAIRGKNFAIIGGDTRLSDGGYGMHSRTSTKVHPLTAHCVIASAGQQSERCTLWKVLDHKAADYKHANKKDMSCTAIAQTLGNTLYYRRFFPYYTFNIVAGVANGKGYVWGYDAVGSFESNPYSSSGTGAHLVTSILDNQVAFKSQPQNAKDLTLEETLAVFKDVFICAGERDIYTGDAVEYCIITEEGTQMGRFELRKD